MRERILEYIRKHGHITTWEAFRDLGCTRLSEYIRQLRLDYIVASKPIKAINRYGEKVTYLEYRIVEEGNDIKGTI